MNTKKCDIFVSYRRADGWELARLLYLYLTENSYNVFFDIEKLFNGQFPSNLNKNLADCKIFIPVLTRETLQRCVTEKDDWVKTEYLTAIESDKIIIPIMDKSFKLPEGLPKEIVELCDPSKYGKGNPKRPLFVKTSKDTFEQDVLKITKLLLEIFKNEGFNDVEKANEKFNSPAILRSEIEKRPKLEKDAVEKLAIEIQKSSYSKIYDRLNDLIWDIRSNILNSKILDISTGFGYFEKRFLDTNKSNVSFLYNIDPNPDSVEVKKIMFGNYDNVEIHNWFPNEGSFLTDLQSLKTKFDIVLIVDILNMYKDPAAILSSIKKVMSDDGIIIIWQQDFGLSFTSPDWNSQLKEFNNILTQSGCVGNKTTGREVFTYLHSLGFKNIHYDLVTNHYSRSEREGAFDKKFNELSAYLKNDKKSQWFAQLKWLDEERNNLKKKYCANKAFNSESFFIWIARNSK